jgi:TolB-like protein
MAVAIAKSGKKTVAVVDFTDLQGCVTELGRFLAEEFSVNLTTAATNFEVIDRTHLKTLLQEHKLASTGIIDPQTARKLGEIAGVQALVTGSLTPFGESVRLSAKVLDVSTAKMIGAFSADIPRTKAIDELLARGISSCGTPTTEGNSTRLSETSIPKNSASPKFETDTYRVTVASVQRGGRSVSVTFFFACSAGQGAKSSPRIGSDVGVGALIGRYNTPQQAGFAKRQQPPSPGSGGCTTVGWRSLYLLDDNGERWELDGGATGSASGGGGALTNCCNLVLLPGTRLKVVLVFSTNGQNPGTQFTLAGQEFSPIRGREILIRGLK